MRLGSCQKAGVRCKRPLEWKSEKEGGRGGNAQPSTHTYIDRFNTWQGNKNTARRRGKNARTHLEKKRRTNPINRREKNSGKRWKKITTERRKKKKYFNTVDFFFLSLLHRL